MGVITSSAQDKVAYYHDQADKLRREAQAIRDSQGDEIEAARLEKLAREADEQARVHEQEIRDVANKIRNS